MCLLTRDHLTRAATTTPQDNCCLGWAPLAGSSSFDAEFTEADVSLNHRGSQLSAMGASLPVALQGSHSQMSSTPYTSECWHFRNGFCTLGRSCKFGHSTSLAASQHGAVAATPPSSTYGFASATEVFSSGSYIRNAYGAAVTHPPTLLGVSEHT